MLSIYLASLSARAVDLGQSVPPFGDTAALRPPSMPSIPFERVKVYAMVCGSIL